jgi:RNA polymerase sigma factor (TIGR02999 family)
MDHPSSGEVTILLKQVKEGNRDAAEKLVAAVYSQLRKMARRFLSQERANHTLQATALVHEAYLQMIDQKEMNWANRAHFFAVSAQLMRHILVDHARARNAGKRGGAAAKVSLDETGVIPLDFVATMQEKHYPQLIMLDTALSKLEQLDPQQSRVIELRFFGGLTEEEIATVMDISLSTVKREWKAARAWLHREMAK